VDGKHAKNIQIHENRGDSPSRNPSSGHLRSLIKSETNLVLCGHRHRPWRWQIENMQVVHAGSVSCEKLRGFFLNSYNVIEIKNKKVNAKLKMVGGGYLNFKEIVKRREVLQVSDISQYSNSLA
jgi:Icc protein